MLKASLIAAGLLAASVAAAQAAEKPTRFWNLTLYEITDFHLAPAGSDDWGPNLAEASEEDDEGDDADGDAEETVQHDERLELPDDFAAGTYDAKLTDIIGRTCVVRGVKVEKNKVFEIEEKDLTDCTGG